MKNSISKRIGWIDAYRGFAIILIVMGHLISFGVVDYTGSESLLLIRRIINIIWLPAFFWISGYLSFKRDRDSVAATINAVFTKIRCLIVPTVVISLVWSFVHRGGYDAIYQGFGRFWFTSTLFEMWVIYYLTAFVFRGKSAVWIVLLISLGITALPLLNIDFNRSALKAFNVLNLCVYFQFFSFGLLSRVYSDRFSQYMTKRNLTAVFFVFFILDSTVQTVKISDGILSKILNIFVSRYLLLLTSVGCFMQADRYLSSNDRIATGIRFIGQKTLDIYFLHYFFIPSLGWIVWMYLPDQLIFQSMTLFVIALAIIGFCLVPSWLLRKSRFMTALVFGR